MDIAAQFSNFDEYPIDRKRIPQEQLDIPNRQRTSLFSWRGQFSPELIESFLSEYARPEGVVLDPFVGSGTTLFECARKSLHSFGVEISPAAVVMAGTAGFVNVETWQREKYCLAAMCLAEKHVGAFEGPLFRYFGQENSADGNSGRIRRMLEESEHDPLLFNTIANAAMRYLSHEEKQEHGGILGALEQQLSVIRRLPYSHNPCRVLQCDARSIPLTDDVSDLIITSPPYINVFNYHQNNRSAMESMGWDMLRVAKSEIGSNRKHRANRFLTVIQYTLDMQQTLVEMRRLIRWDGRIIVVVGRVSNVRGVSFRNGRILACLAQGASGLKLVLRQERKFKNKFGETIYEDILHLERDGSIPPSAEGFARKLSYRILEEALHCAPTDVQNDILSAMLQVTAVQASPLFDLACQPMGSTRT